MNTLFAFIVFIGYLVICNHVGKMLPREIAKKAHFVYPSFSDSIVTTQKYANKPKNKTDVSSKKGKRSEKYIWDNSTYYDFICKELQSKYTNTTPALSFQFAYGGFGNQLYSLLTTSLMAAVQDYHLYFIYPHYNSIFDSCYSKSILKRVDSMQYTKNCTPYTKCFQTKPSFWDVRKSIGYENTIISGLLMDPNKILNNPKYLHQFTELFSKAGSDVSEWNIRKTMLRLILNPESKLRNQLLIEKKQLLQYAHTIGLQLRMGGNVSDAPEKYVGIPFSRVDEVIEQVKRCIEDRGWEGDVQVYISSDSSKTIRYIQEKTKDDFPVVESLLFKHGHTSSFLLKNEYVNVLKKVVSDLYYMSICDRVIVSWPSSLGRMMCYLGEQDNCEAVLGWKVEDKRIDIQ